MRPLLLLRLAPWLLLPSCMVGPDYQPPQAEIEAAFKSAGFTAPAPDGSWWKLFGDAELSRLIKEIKTSNPSALAALARYKQVNAEIGITRSQGSPLVMGEAYANRKGDSSNSNFPCHTECLGDSKESQENGASTKQIT